MAHIHFTYETTVHVFKYSQKTMYTAFSNEIYQIYLNSRTYDNSLSRISYSNNRVLNPFK